RISLVFGVAAIALMVAVLAGPTAVRPQRGNADSHAAVAKDAFAPTHARPPEMNAALAAAAGHAALPKATHAIYAQPASDRTTAMIPALDAALAIEGRDALREQQVLEQVTALLKDDPAGEQITVACGHTFCRLRIGKQVGRGMPWHEIDKALRSVVS